MRTQSLGGKSYTLVIVDDFSRFTWVLFLGNKNYAFKAFSRLCKRLQNEQELKIKKMRSDHGGEFKNHEFQSYYEENGIHHNLLVSRTPQQNGIIERKNRTLIEMSRTMLVESVLPKYF